MVYRLKVISIKTKSKSKKTREEINKFKKYNDHNVRIKCLRS